jgi:hypothetical protein
VSATPRTDAEAVLAETGAADEYSDFYVKADFARQLETELNESKARLAKASRYLTEEVNPAVEVAEIEVSKLRAKLQAAEADAERLAVALVNIAARGRPHAGSAPGYPDGCECELCENFDSISRALAAHEARKEGE